MSVNAVAFYGVAAVALTGAIAAVLLPDLRRAALALGASMIAVGLLYLVLDSDLVGVAQIVVAGVGVPVLVLGALGAAAGGERTGGLARTWPLAALVGAALFAVVVAVLHASVGSWREADYPQRLLDQGTTSTIGDTLVNGHALPLEAAAVVLLASLVGVAVLGRRDSRELRFEEAEADRRARSERAQRRREDRERARRSRGESVGAGAAPEEPA